MNKTCLDIKKAAAGFQPTQLAILKAFSKIDCGTGNLDGNKKVCKIVDEQLKKIKGIKIKHYSSAKYGSAVVATLTPPQYQGSIIINSHLDTVYKEGDTQKHPFHVVGDTAYGLGIADCKGGFVVSVYAVLIMQKLGKLPNKKIVMIYNPDEEVGSPFGYQIFKKIVNQEKPEAAFVFEPSRNEDGIITSRKAGIHYLMEVKGRSAHSGVNYTDGINAVVELANKISTLYQLNDNQRGIQFNFGHINCGGRDLGVIPDYASCDISVRHANVKEAHWIDQTIKKVISKPFIPGAVTKATLTYAGHPMERTQGNIKLYKMAKKAGKMLGYDLPQQKTGGGSDASHFNYLGVPAIDALGPYMYKIHSFDENLRISSLSFRTALFATILLNL